MDSHEKKLLFDVLESGRSVQGWCSGTSFAEYQTDRRFRRAVEREFEIIGEALNRLSRQSEATASRITALPRIVGFRNRLTHGYDAIDDAAVCRVFRDQRLRANRLTSAAGKPLICTHSR
jgi:uncharacterized protein with HEPN domain